ncbi:MAG: ATP-binding cassette domain-containing protein, partial [Pseudomonadota bacterium]
AETVRAMPDAASGAAGALCLWVCLTIGLGVADAVAALTALALLSWPLRHLADVRDRQKAFGVACGKLDAALSSPRLPMIAKANVDPDAPAIQLDRLSLPGLEPIDLTLERGALRRLSGPPSSGKSRLLLTLAGLDTAPSDGRLLTLGRHPAALPPGSILYLGARAPLLKGSLRRNLILGTARTPEDSDIEAILGRVGLSDLAARLGGLDGQVAEGARNLTSTERSRLFLARGLIARAYLALVDADEIGLNRDDMTLLIDHFQHHGTAALVVTAKDREHLFKDLPVVLRTLCPVDEPVLLQSCA